MKITISLQLSVKKDDAQCSNATRKVVWLKEPNHKQDRAEMLSHYFSALRYAESDSQGWISRPFQEEKKQVQKMPFQGFLNVPH